MEWDFADRSRIVRLYRAGMAPSPWSAVLAVMCRRAVAGRAAFWMVAFVFGILGTPIFNCCAGPFIFTWPVCLFVAHQMALNTIVSVNQSSRPTRGRWWSLAAVAVFLAVCVGYYLACRRLSLATEWAFLVGFLPSWPAAVPTAYRFSREPRPTVDTVCLWLSFTLFFWGVGAILLWQAAKV